MNTIPFLCSGFLGNFFMNVAPLLKTSFGCTPLNGYNIKLPYPFLYNNEQKPHYNDLITFTLQLINCSINNQLTGKINERKNNHKKNNIIDTSLLLSSDEYYRINALHCT